MNCQKKLKNAKHSEKHAKICETIAKHSEIIANNNENAKTLRNVGVCMLLGNIQSEPFKQIKVKTL